MRKQNLQPHWSVQFRNYTCSYWVKKKAEIAEIEKKVTKLCIYPCQTRDHATVEKLSEQFCVVGKTQSWKRAAPGGWYNLASKAGPLDGTDLGHRSEHSWFKQVLLLLVRNIFSDVFWESEVQGHSKFICTVYSHCNDKHSALLLPRQMVL